MKCDKDSEPMKPMKPWTPTRDTQYPGKEYQVLRVGVQVGLVYPRVTHAVPYTGLQTLRTLQTLQITASSTGFLQGL